MSWILAIDLGKFKSVTCLLDSDTNQTEFWTMPHTRLHSPPFLKNVAGVASTRERTLSRPPISTGCAPDVERPGRTDEWCVVLRKSFEHLAFDHVPGLKHRIVFLRPAFA